MKAVFAEMTAGENEIADLISRMALADRRILARMLEEQVFIGVFETIKVLEEFEIQPIIGGHEGSPHEDFVGRRDDWEWPKS